MVGGDGARGKVRGTRRGNVRGTVGGFGGGTERRSQPWGRFGKGHAWLGRKGSLRELIRLARSVASSGVLPRTCCGVATVTQGRTAGINTSSHHCRKLVGVAVSAVRTTPSSRPSSFARIMSTMPCTKASPIP